MPEFPPAPLSPQEFIENWLPKAFAEAELPPGSDQVDVQLGVKLEGDGGGEWVFRIQGGQVSVAAGSREDTAFTYVQSVDDWRGALWEGRGGAIGSQSAALFRPGAQAAKPSPGQMGAGGAPSPAALEQMRQLDGVIRMAVSGGEGGDWKVDFKLGPGAIPAEPTTRPHAGLHVGPDAGDRGHGPDDADAGHPDAGCRPGHLRGRERQLLARPSRALRPALSPGPRFG
jgi:hypothetical protein